MSYLLSFDVSGEDGHSIECRDLAAVRSELEGEYFREDEIDDAMQELTNKGVWRGEGESIKLFVQCGAAGVKGLEGGQDAAR